MAEYNGSIELISGLIQKNNADFPLMEASAVAFYEEVQLDDGSTAIQEIRLPDKLKSVGISEKDKEELIKTAVAGAETALEDDLTALSNRIGANAGSVDSLTTRIESVEEQVKNGDNPNLRVHYEQKESMLYLYDDPQDANGLIKPDIEAGIKGNVISSTTIVGGGSGASLPYTLILRKLNNLKTVRKGQPAEIRFSTEMKSIPASEGEEAVPVDKTLTFRLTVKSDNRGTLTTTFKEESNQEKSFDVTPYLGDGRNEISLAVSYTEEITVEGEVVPVSLVRTQSWVIKVIELYLESTFNDTIAFVNQNAPWTGFAYGDINKTIHYELNGEPWRITENLINKEESVSQTIPFQGHGTSTLSIYLSAKVEGEDGKEVTIYSDRLNYELLFIDSQESTPVIRLKATPSPMQQYTAGTISFTVYSNNQIIKTVTLKEGEDNIIFSGETNNDAKNYPYTFMDFGEKTITLSYFYNEIEYKKSINVTVEPSQYQINPVTTGLVLDFLPTGRSNDANDYNVFYNHAANLVAPDVAATLPEIAWDFSENFDWNNGGWQTDSENNTFFCVKAGTQVAINYDPFKDSTIIKNGKSAGTGKEFKLIFKATNVSQPNATFLSCLDESNVGLQMNVHEAYINSNEKQIYSPYCEEDIIEFDFNIFPGVDTGTSLQPVGDIIPMTMTYEDGTPFQPSIHTLSTSYEHLENKPIIIGSPDCDIHIYRMKVYNRYLTDKEVLSNFIADARNGAEMVDRHARNLIYDKGVVTPNSLAKARPDLKIIKITCPKFTNSKSDFQPMTSVEMIHKNGDPVKDNWKFEDCFIVGQGTTSNNYRDAGKNLEFICCFDGKYKNKKILNDYYGGDSERYYKHRTKLTLNPNDDNPANRIDNSYDATLEENPGDGKVALHEGAYPNNYFNVKVNIASSENANNALQANRYQRFMPYITPAQKRDSRIKTTMDFVNCVVFLCETDPSGIEFPPASVITEPSDSDYHFYAIGNIGDSKKTDGDRVYMPGDDDNEFVVEILDNDKPNAGFPTGFKTEANEFIYPITREQWEAIDGYRKVEDELYLIDDNLPVFYELIDGEYVKTEDETIDPSKTYYEVNYLNLAYENLYVDKFRMTDKGPVQDSGWAASYEMRYGEDSKANIDIWNEFYEWLIFSSNAEFKSQFSNWFIQNAALYYFLFTERYTMMDNRAKNSFWHWAKFYITEEEAAEMGENAKYYTVDNAAAVINKGYRFDFWDYDNDTALGIDNNGKLKFPYGLEDIDKNADGTFVFNAGNSVFFRRIRDNFTTELTTVYSTTTSSDAWDPNNLINEYDKWQSEFPEALWLEDTERKYYRTYRNKVLGLPSLTQDWLTAHLTDRMQGRKKYQRRQWERDQADYMDSKYGTSRAQNKSLLLRCKTPPVSVVPADYTWHLHPYKKMYLRTYRGEVLQDSIRALDLDKTYDLIGSTTALEDAQLRVYSANCIQDFGDISPFYAYSVEAGSGTEKIKSFVVGNSTDGYQNDNLNNLEIGTAKILKTLNIQNLAKVTSVSLVPSLQYLYAQGSGLTNASFAKGGAIVEAYLPSTINTIKADDLYYLEKIELDDYDKLQTLLIDKCPKLTTNGYDLQIVNNANNLKVVRLTNVNWKLSDTSILNKLLKCTGIADDNTTPTEQSVLTGTIYVPIIRQTELEAYNAKWPKLTVNYGEEMPQHSVIFRNNNEVIYTMLVDEGTTLTAEDDPVLNGTIPTPSIPNSEDGQFTYIYKAWQTVDGKSFIGTKITNTDITFDAIYETKVRTYSVKWFKDVNSNTTLQTAEVEWGKSVEYDYGENNVNLPIKIPGANDNKFYLFEKWDKASTNVKADLDIYPVWADSNPNLIGDKPTNELTAADVYGLKQVKDLSGAGKKFSTPGQVLTLQMGYMPSYANVEEDVLISSTTTFDGIGQYQDTDYALFENSDSSFVLAIDFEMGNSTGTLVSCYRNNRNGFKIEPTNGIGTVPSVVYKNPSKRVNVGFIAPTADRTHREICVIRKVKGDNRLYVYTNNRYSLDDIQENILFDTDTFASSTTKLCFGASLRSDNSHEEYAAGTIHYAKLWLDDIGADECKKICSWTYEKQEFEYVGKGLHFYENSDLSCQATFVAKNLLDEIIAFNNFDKNEITLQGYGPSQIRQWLQKKPFLGTSLLWQQVVSKVQIPTLLGYNDMNELSFGTLYSEDGEAPSDYFYLPCAADLDSTFLTGTNSVYYKNESTSGESYPIFAQNSDRIKTLGNSNVQYSYWTRSPYRSDNTMYGVVPTNRDSSSKPAGSLSNYYRSADTGEQRFFHSYSTDYQRSTKQHGVLITFSI